MIEIWKPIPGWESFYLVSNHGRIKSIPRVIHFVKNGRRTQRRVFERILSNGRDKTTSYPLVCLCGTRFRRFHFVHHLVAKVFVPNPKQKPMINHKDGNKSNCKASNLEWVTQKENAEHAARIGLIPRGGAHHNSKLSKKEVLEIRLLLKKRLSQVTIASKYNISQTAVSDIKLKRNYKWVR